MNKYIAFTGILTVLAATNAYAGFQWNPPPAKAPMAAPTMSGDMPKDMPMAVEKGPLTPMVDDGAPMAVPQATAVIEPVAMEQMAPPPQTIDDVPPLDTQESDLMTMPVPGEMADAPMPLQSAAPIPAPAATNMAEGFGKDIPLAIALRQVVPPQYAVSYQPGVDQGKPVTWNGGRPWNEVVSDMLAGRKMYAAWNGNNLMIAEGSGPALPMPSNVAATATPSAAVNYLPRPVVDVTSRKMWVAKPGQTLQQVLKNWTMEAHAELAWEDAGDVPVSSEFSYNGTFDQAVDALLSLYNVGQNEPHAKLYPNLPQGPSVLLVSIR